MKKDAVLTLPLFLDLGARRKFARNLEIESKNK